MAKENKPKPNNDIVERGKATRFKSGAQQAEIARKGGIASQKKQHEKRSIYETLSIMLEMPLKDGQVKDIKSIASIAGTKNQNLTVQDAVILAQIARALKGDVKAAQFVKDLIDNAQSKTDNSGVQIIDDF